MTEPIHCDNCGTIWTEDQLDPVHDFWSRVEPGGVIPIGQCPDETCGALCYPPYGYVHNLECELAAYQDVLARLLEWEQCMGGWEASVWDEARSVMGHARDTDTDEEVCDDHIS